jgi:hypothetical protein
MLSRRGSIAIICALFGASVGLLPVTAVGRNPWDLPGTMVSEGFASRIVDPVTGAGLFNPNTDPNTVGIDPITGVDAPVGTDVGFAAPLWRGIRSGVLNGDFALPPPDTSLPISDDNPLPYWRWVPDAAGHITATWVDGSVRFDISADASYSDLAYIESHVRITATDARAYTYQPSAYWATAGGGLTGFRLVAQYLEDDASTTVGSAYTSTESTVQKLRAYPAGDGRVPADAVYLRLRVGVTNLGGAATHDLLEVAADGAPVPSAGNPYGVKARRTASQSIGDGADESIVFTASDEWDPDALHPASDVGVYVGDDGGGLGYYLLIGNVEWDANATGARSIWFEYNGIDGGGTDVPGSKATVAPVNGGPTRQTTTAVYYATDAVGGFFAMTVRQNSGGALDVTDATFTVIRIAG